MCKVSVLVPVYNVKKYLRQCLDSLAAQTLKEIEFICIDDGSTDGSGAILDAYAAKDARFRVIHKANSGYGASMNVGLRAARGEYIGIVESDDFADAEMFAALYDVAAEHQADVVRSNYMATSEAEGDVFREELHGYPYGKVFCPLRDLPRISLAMPNVWSAIYRKNFLTEKNLWFHETPGASFQDLSFAFLVIACAERYFLLKKAYLHYRIDNAGSSSYSKEKTYCILDEYDEIERYIDAYGLNQIWHTYAANLLLIHCGLNERRIDKRYWLPFWEQAAKRLTAAHQNGWLDHEIADHPGNWIFHHLSNLYQEALLREGFLSHLRRTQSVYLYGASQTARGIMRLLASSNIRVAGLLVTDSKKNPTAVAGVPVYAIADAPVDREKDLVIIAVTPKKQDVQQEIFFSLVQAGYRNVIVFTKELQQALC